MSENILSQPSTSTSLLQRARDGEAIAWQELVQLYGPIVYAWIRRSNFQASDAADIMQETLSAVVTQLGRFNAVQSGATFRGWLWTITRNKCVDFVRRQKLHPPAIGGSTMQQRIAEQPAIQSDDSSQNKQSFGSHTISENLPPSDMANDRSAVCRRALALLRKRFEPQTWQAFWRTTVDGNSVEDVAAELEMTRWAVYKARSRILAQLRTHLAGLEDLP